MLSGRIIFPKRCAISPTPTALRRISRTGAELLANEASIRRKMGGDFYLYRLKDSASKILKKGGYLNYIGETNIFDSKAGAIEGVFSRLDKEICRRCKNRIFLECRKVPTE